VQQDMPPQLARVMSERSWQELVAPINAACAKRNRTAAAAQLAAVVVLLSLLSTLALSLYSVVSPEVEYSHLTTFVVWPVGIVAVPLINCWVAKVAGDVVSEVRDLLGKRCAGPPRAQALLATPASRARTARSYVVDTKAPNAPSLSFHLREEASRPPSTPPPPPPPPPPLARR